MYYVAKKCSQRCSPEEYAIALARHFVKTYPKARCLQALAAWLQSTRADADFACCLCKLLIDTHSFIGSRQVSKAKIDLEATPWQRVSTGGQPHQHGEQCLPIFGSSWRMRYRKLFRLVRLCWEILKLIWQSTGVAGFAVGGSELRTVYASVDMQGKVELISGTELSA